MMSILADKIEQFILHKLLEEEEEVPEKDPAADISAVKGNVCFEHVQFGYDDTLLMKDVNIEVKQGQMVALVSDAGMPAICDPGSDLVRLAIEADIPIVPLPGANAGLTGLIASGMDTTQFTFIGFLPKTQKHRRPVLERVKSYGGTLIFYEAPHRIQTVLRELIDVLGDRQAVICRELTKRYEQYMRGPLSQVTQELAEQGARGEFVILVAGAADSEDTPAGDGDYAAQVRKLMDQGVDKKEAVRIVAKRCGAPKRSVYQAALTLS